jgi:membrane-bound serine protease (ClpP class)
MLFFGAVLLAIFVVPRPYGLALVAAAAVVEIGETFFWVWLSKRRRVQVGAETLIGAVAEAASPCRPEGQVRIGGELWSARCEAGAEPGEKVRVLGRNGLTLLVEPAEMHDPADAVDPRRSA